MDSMIVPSVLDAVTVYAEGAICTRLARLALAQGLLPTSVRVAGLPLGLRPDMLRARIVNGPADLKVRDVRSALVTELAPELDVAAEQRALEQAQETVARLELGVSLAQGEIDNLVKQRPSFPPRAKGAPPREAPLPAVLALADFVDTEVKELQARLRDLDAQLRDARQDVELRARRLAESSVTRRVERAQLSRVATISLTTPQQPGDAELAVEYLVPGARWAPAYDLRLDRAMQTGTLRMRAVVAQRSGEDWRNVRLSLSTADLDRRSEAPELRSLRIGRAQPPPPRSGWRDPPAGLEELFADFDAAWKRPAKQAAPQFQPPPPPPRAEPMEKLEVMDEEFDQPSTLGGGLPGGGAVFFAKNMPTAPPPMAAPCVAPSPARASAAPEMMKSKKSAAPRMAARMRRDESAKEMAAMADGFMAAPAEDMDEGGFGGAAPAEPEAPASGLDNALLDFGLLSLPDPLAGGTRGRLQPQDRDRLEVVMSTSVHVQVDVLLAVLRKQRSDAQGVASLPLPSQASPVRASAGSYDYRYDAEHRLDLDADGAWHSVPVMTTDVELTPLYVTVPVLDDKVFRSLTVRNRSTHALLAGPTDVTLGDEFLMTVRLPTLPPGGEERMGLGVEEAVRVARNTRFKETTGGLLSNATLLQHDVEIEVANRLGHAAEVEVRERLPVSNDDDIKIEEHGVKPAWQPDTKVRDGVFTKGARVWRLRLESGGKANLVAQYTVKIPSDKMLVGGNRRA